MFDSGSQVTLINEGFFKKLGKPLHPLEDLVLWHGGGGQIPYLGWTDVEIGFDVDFCGTSRASAVLALVVPDGRDATHYQLIIGTNSGALRNCYMFLFGSQGEREVQESPNISAACRQIYRDFEMSNKTGPEGRIGLINRRSHGRRNLVISARSQKFVSGTIRNRLGRPVTTLIDAANSKRLPSGIDTVCSLVNIGAGFRRVKVCLQNQTDRDIQIPNECALAAAFLPASVSSPKPDEKEGSDPPTTDTAQSDAARASHGSLVPPSSGSKITEDEFKALPFVRGPIDATWKDRILEVAYSYQEVFSQHEWADERSPARNSSYR